MTGYKVSRTHGHATWDGERCFNDEVRYFMSKESAELCYERMMDEILAEGFEYDTVEHEDYYFEVSKGEMLAQQWRCAEIEEIEIFP